jgi:hypothetical protein
MAMGERRRGRGPGGGILELERYPSGISQEVKLAMCRRISPETWRKVMMALGLISIGFAVAVLLQVHSVGDTALKTSLIGTGIAIAGLGFQFLTMSRREGARQTIL